MRFLKSLLPDADPVYTGKYTSSRVVLLGNINAAVNLADLHTNHIWANREYGWVTIDSVTQFDNYLTVDIHSPAFKFLKDNIEPMRVAAQIYYNNPALIQDIPFHEYLNTVFFPRDS